MSLPVNIVSNLEGVAYSHTMITVVDVLGYNDEVLATIDTVSGGTVRLDSTASSRGRIDITVLDDGTRDLIPEEPGDLLVPYGNELRVRRGIVKSDRIDLVQLGIFGIDRSKASDTGEVSVSGLDRSWHFIDSPFEEPYEIASGTQLNDALEEVLTMTWPLVQMDFMQTDVQLPRLQAEEAEDKWAFAQGLALSVGGELFFDDQGVAKLAPVPSAGGNPIASFAEGEGGVLLGTEREWDRAPVVNRWIVTGENTSGALPVPRAVATDDESTSPTFYGGKFGKKPDFYDNEFINSNEQADAVANSLLSRTIGAPDTMTFQTLVDPGRRPGDLIRVVREQLGINEDHLIDGLAIPLSSSGLMDSQTRVAQELVA